MNEWVVTFEYKGQGHSFRVWTDTPQEALRTAEELLIALHSVTIERV